MDRLFVALLSESTRLGIVDVLCICHHSWGRHCLCMFFPENYHLLLLSKERNNCMVMELPTEVLKDRS